MIVYIKQSARQTCSNLKLQDYIIYLITNIIKSVHPIHLNVSLMSYQSFVRVVFGFARRTSSIVTMPRSLHILLNSSNSNLALLQSIIKYFSLPHSPSKLSQSQVVSVTCRLTRLCLRYFRIALVRFGHSFKQLKGPPAISSCFLDFFFLDQF